jgi:hypothetical protein
MRRPFLCLVIAAILASVPYIATAEIPDTSALVLSRDIDSLPGAVLSKLGRTKTGHNEMVAPDESFNATDVLDGRPRRRFVLAGVSDRLIIVAYEQGGIATSCVVTAFVQSSSGWVARSRWYAPRPPTTLSELISTVPASEK